MRELDRLAVRWPDFRFSQETLGRRGTCWIAQRHELGIGVHTVITRDLDELRSALPDDEAELASLRADFLDYDIAIQDGFLATDDAS
jgi:hypothetical protein